jgi:hypothetical protein
MKTTMTKEKLMNGVRFYFKREKNSGVIVHSYEAKLLEKGKYTILRYISGGIDPIHAGSIENEIRDDAFDYVFINFDNIYQGTVHFEEIEMDVNVETKKLNKKNEKKDLTYDFR